VLGRLDTTRLTIHCRSFDLSESDFLQVAAVLRQLEQRAAQPHQPAGGGRAAR
jgi:hypothetical protein